jgi:hypothetical protein
LMKKMRGKRDATASAGQRQPPPPHLIVQPSIRVHTRGQADPHPRCEGECWLEESGVFFLFFLVVRFFAFSKSHVPEIGIKNRKAKKFLAVEREKRIRKSSRFVATDCVKHYKKRNCEARKQKERKKYKMKKKGKRHEKENKILSGQREKGKKEKKRRKKS